MKLRATVSVDIDPNKGCRCCRFHRWIDWQIDLAHCDLFNVRVVGVMRPHECLNAAETASKEAK